MSGNACNNGIDDMAYVRALVADIGTHIAVDNKRTFASGFSNGAALSQQLACQAAPAASPCTCRWSAAATTGRAALRPRSAAIRAA